MDRILDNMLVLILHLLIVQQYRAYFGEPFRLYIYYTFIHSSCALCVSVSVYECVCVSV